jgi:hypothetical protein
MAVRQGDIVRFELDDSAMWFYCRVAQVLDSGDLECCVVEAQSWPHVALAGYLPGRPYLMPAQRVLSVVQQAA